MDKKIRLVKLNRQRKFDKFAPVIRLGMLLFFVMANVSAYAIKSNTGETRQSKALENSISIADNSSNQQQNRKVTGKVTDSKGATLPGVSVVVKGTTTGTITDANGVYSLSGVSDKAILEFSFVGMKKVDIAVGNKAAINVSLEDETIGLEEVVAIGYGTQKKVDMTGAVTTMKSEKIELLPVSNLSNAMEGRMSGVYVDQPTGVPGVAANIRIRAQGSWNDSPPLYIIDGVVRDKYAFDALDASEVSDISILKDAASAAIYGSRSSNGVFLITTKKGVSGKPVISYSGSYSMDTPVQLQKVLGVTEQMDLNNAVLRPDHWGSFGPTEYEYFKKNGFYNWLDEIYQTPTGQKNAVNVSGGNENVKYFISATNFKQDGFIPQLKYSKFNLRASVEAKITKDLTASLQLGGNTSTKQKYQHNYDNNTDDLNTMWAFLWDAFSFNRPYLPDGRAVYPYWEHPLEAIRHGYNKNTGMGYDAVASLDYKLPFVKGLSIKGTYSRNISSSNTKIFQEKYEMWEVKTSGEHGKIYSTDLTGNTYWSAEPGRESLSSNWDKSDSYQLNGQLAYTRDFGKHHIDGVLVYEQFESAYNYLNAMKSDFPLVKKDQFPFTSNDVTGYSIGGAEYPDARISYVGRLNYTFADKYLLSTSVRRDGSYRFAPDKRWGIFPAVSLGWRISEEPFFKNNVTFMDNLKLRGSFGKTGNDAVGGWQWYDKVVNSGSYIWGDKQNLFPAISYTSAKANPNLTWEKSNSYNVGIDTRFFKSISFTAEYWYKHTYDILGSRIASLPGTYGGSLPDENYGQVDSKGYELELTYDGKVGHDFNYFVRANFAYATNKVVKMDVAQNTRDVDNPIGRPLYYKTGLVSTGIIRTQADLDKLPAGYTIWGNTPHLGDLNYQDISGVDGKPDGKIDDFDRQVVDKYNTAPYTMGLNIGANWKGFSLELFFAGATGAKKYHANATDGRSYNVDHAPAFWGDMYRPANSSSPNVNGSMPLFTDGESYNGLNSTFWLFDASYARLKNATIGYTIPKQITQKIKIDKIQVFVSGTNLLTIQKNKFGYDVAQYGQTSYPLMKTFTFGLNVSL